MRARLKSSLVINKRFAEVGGVKGERRLSEERRGTERERQRRSWNGGSRHGREKEMPVHPWNTSFGVNESANREKEKEEKRHKNKKRLLTVGIVAVIDKLLLVKVTVSCCGGDGRYCLFVVVVVCCSS